MAHGLLGISSFSASCPVSPSTPITDAALPISPFSSSGISAVINSFSLNFASSRCAVQGKTFDSVDALRGFHFVEKSRRRCARTTLPVVSATGPSDGVKWWEKDGGPNMIDVHSAKELTDAIGAAGEKLVVVDFYASWCGSCRALYPKLCRLAADHPDIVFLKINFDENKPLCKSLSVKVLPFFHLYRGAAGRLDAFSCSITKLQKLKDAIAIHNTERCSLGPPVGLQIDPVDTSKTGMKDEPATAGSAR